jgi:hypothetical protein
MAALMDPANPYVRSLLPIEQQFSDRSEFRARCPRRLQSVASCPVPHRCGADAALALLAKA